MTIKAILFDMGGTLVSFDVEHPGEIFQRALISLGISRSLAETKIAFLNAEKEAKDLNLLSSFGKMDREKYWNQWDALVLKYLGIAENVELARIVQSKWFDFVNFALYPEVKDVLMKLQQRGLKLGLISTGYEDGIHLILEKVNLEKATFDIIVGVDTIEKVKPDPDIFRYAIRKLNVRPEEAIFVGDSVEADYRGAKSAGLHALLIDRIEKQQSDLRTIKNLKEILSQIN
ncbi:MAG: HAD family hydrolase [Candidatus Bathyarchaeota archaeon]|nr:MAG: HAD family hydrolase [Candidatus Bathyarchaeota archaeon]